MTYKPLTLAEKLAIVGVFCDVPQDSRQRLLSLAAAWTRSGALVGNNFIATMDDGKVVVRFRRSMTELMREME